MINLNTCHVFVNGLPDQLNQGGIYVLLHHRGLKQNKKTGLSTETVACLNLIVFLACFVFFTNIDLVLTITRLRIDTQKI